MVTTPRCIREASPSVVAAFCAAFLLSGCGVDRTVALDPGDPSLASSSSGMSPPSTLTATAVSATRIEIAWRDNATRETGFQVQRSTTGGGGSFSVLTTVGSNVTSYGNDGLGQATQYCYRVRAVRTNGGSASYSAFSNTACGTTLASSPPPPPPPGPNAPSGVVVSPFQNRITITWVDNSDNEEWFVIESSPAASGPWTLVTTLQANQTSTFDMGVPSEQQRCYRVIAFRAQVASAPSSVACTTLPAIPSGLTAVGTDGPSVNLTWSDNSSAEDGYQVQRGSGNGSYSPIAELPANTTTYSDPTVSNGETYAYFVRAKKDGGFSYTSNFAYVAVGPPRPPAKPTFSAIEGYYLGTILLAWLNSQGLVDSYKIERCDKETCADGDFTVVATVPATTDFVMMHADGGADWTIYTYRLRATNHVGDSEPSDPWQGRTCIEGVDPESPCYPPLPNVGTSMQRAAPSAARIPGARRLSPSALRP
jgi:Fibronectin type III domain